MPTIISKNQKNVFQRGTIIKPGIDLIVLVNKRGRMVESIGTGDIGISKPKKEMFLMKIALRSAMQKDFDEDLGGVNYCMTQRGNRKFISIPTYDDSTVLVVTKSDFEHEEFVKNITQTLKNSDQFLGETLFKGGKL
ncbi:MAG: hypothetical protein IH841_08860 [Thaumarchaeota archaeon]|nr:hypothetical protein [Nitrososphaerota archaeon]